MRLTKQHFIRPRMLVCVLERRGTARDIAGLIAKCTAAVPDERPSASEVLHMLVMSPDLDLELVLDAQLSQAAEPRMGADNMHNDQML